MVVFSRFTTSGLGGAQSRGTTLVPGMSCAGMMVDGGDVASSCLVPGGVVRFPSGDLAVRSPPSGICRGGANCLDQCSC